jgi:tetratricopeptide (TPR) repeat protein
MLPQERIGEQDRVATTLRAYAHNILAVVFGLLPLLFIPTIAAPFEYTKVFAVFLGIFLALILYSLSVLRSGLLRVSFSYALGALWLVVLSTLLSGLLSGDFTDSLIGDLFSVHAVAFTTLVALIPTTVVLLAAGKTVVMRTYKLLAFSTIVLVLFHILRIVFGTDMLSLGVFMSNVATPVGSWNDLALFLGLVVILSLVALEQLALTKVGRISTGIVTLGALFMLGVINFFTVWIVLGVASLVVVVFTLGRDRSGDAQLLLMGGDTQKAQSFASLGHALVVFFVSVLFVVGGSTLGAGISRLTGIEYVEVRPSFEATADITRAVYEENALLGAGTNRFADAWRMYKDTSINATVFWNTDFNAGNGYIPTFFVTTGILGGLAWMLFIVVYAVTGARRLLSPGNAGDRVWYFIAVASFVSALYIWGISLVYVPGVVMLLIGALQTGISLHAFSVLGGKEGTVITVSGNRRARFVLTLVTVIVIIGSVGVLYAAGRHYSAIYAFNTSIAGMQSGASIEATEGRVASAFQLFSSDVFARRVAEYQLAKMNTLVGISQPDEGQQRQFNEAVTYGINAANIAIENDPDEPANHTVLGNIYSLLTSVSVEGAYDRAAEQFDRVQALNPKNPLPLLERAILEARAGNIEAARTRIAEAIALKSNFVEAFFLLSQIEIATGNVEAAISSTQATITLDPQNPARYYQLGILERARSNTQAAATAFEQAILLDADFANARYHLALAYDELGRSADAKTQLEYVLTLNPGNADVATLINVLATEGSLQRLRAATSQTVTEQQPVTTETGTVTTTGSSDSPLITPINTPPGESVAVPTE